jgi:hypothetical protein
MSKLNILVHLNAYSDAASTNNPNLNNFKWSRDVQGLAIDEAKSEGFRLASGVTNTIFNGSRTISHDGTTIYDLSIKAGTANTYILKATGGTLPVFKTLRALTTSAATTLAVTKNANLVTVTVSGGPAVDFIAAGVVAGDLVLLGTPFATQNQGTFKLLSATTTSISFENAGGVAQATVSLTAGFADEMRIFSAAGVQIGDTLAISGGFSALTQSNYEITYVADYYLEFYSTATLPQETKTTNQIAAYTDAKQLIYIESNKKLNVTINGTQILKIEPFVNGNTVTPGMLLLKANIFSLSVSNADASEASVYVASVE